MAGQSSQEEGGCRVRFRVEWAMWGNMNALYAAVSKFENEFPIEII